MERGREEGERAERKEENEGGEERSVSKVEKEKGRSKTR
jgi:hypothetical protein